MKFLFVWLLLVEVLQCRFLSLVGYPVMAGLRCMDNVRVLESWQHIPLQVHVRACVTYEVETTWEDRKLPIMVECFRPHCES